MEKLINTSTGVASPQPLKYWRKVKPSDKSFRAALDRVGAKRYSEPGELAFNDGDILLLQTNGKGIFVWKTNLGTAVDFTSTIFYSRSECPRVQLLKDALAAVRNIKPDSTVAMRLGSELVEIATDKLLEEAGFFIKP